MDGLSIDVRSNVSSIALELRAAAQDMRDTALVRALNKMGQQVITTASKEIRKAGYNLKASDIKKALSLKRATQSSKVATVTASGRPVPLIKYGAKQTSQGVTVSVLHGRKLIPGAFIATMPTGHTGVFVLQPGGKHRKFKKAGRSSWHQLPIRELFGPGIPDAAANAGVRSAVEALVVEKFPRILEHEHAWLSKRTRGR